MSTDTLTRTDTPAGTLFTAAGTAYTVLVWPAEYGYRTVEVKHDGHRIGDAMAVRADDAERYAAQHLQALAERG